MEIQVESWGCIWASSPWRTGAPSGPVCLLQAWGRDPGCSWAAPGRRPPDRALQLALPGRVPGQCTGHGCPHCRGEKTKSPSPCSLCVTCAWPPCSAESPQQPRSSRRLLHPNTGPNLGGGGRGPSSQSSRPLSAQSSIVGCSLASCLGCGQLGEDRCASRTGPVSAVALTTWLLRCQPPAQSQAREGNPRT